jgi:tRNA (cytidine/uridine-2'-O-)-methyltransferase
MTVELALYQPDIPQNTGALMRLSACLGFTLHIVHPAGFSISNRHLRRSAMDYAEAATLREHDSYSHFDAWRRDHGRRLVLLTTGATESAYKFAFSANDVLLAGRETGGVPENVAKAADAAIRIPMRPGLRSLNVALASAMLMGEAMRQTDALPSLVADGQARESM